MRRSGLLLPVFMLLPACGGAPAHANHDGLTESASPLRPPDRDPSDPYDYEAGATIEHVDSPTGRFRTHFTRTTRDAVPVRDADADGTPDFAAEIGLIADDVADFYEAGLGFIAARSDASVSSNGGSDAFDFYLLDFNGAGDGAYRTDRCDGTPRTCIGFMVVENDYAGYGYPNTTVANRILVSHEYFHAVQAAYFEGAGDPGESVLREGTAVWATEQYDPVLNDFEAFIDGYLERTDRSLDKPLPGPTDAFSYGAALWWQFLSERYGREIVRRVWERRPERVRWLDVTTAVLADEYDTTFAEAFLEFTRWNQFTGEFADAAQSYDRGGRYPRPAATDASLPVEALAIRLSYASSRAWAVDGGRTLDVVLVPDPEDTRENSGLSLLVAYEKSGDLARVDLHPALTEPVTIDATLADRVVFTVVNADSDGEWRRPSLCIDLEGALDTSACLATPAPDAGPVPPDAGDTMDAGAEADGGSGGEVPGPCGCGGASTGIALLAPLLRRRTFTARSGVGR